MSTLDDARRQLQEARDRGDEAEIAAKFDRWRAALDEHIAADRNGRAERAAAPPGPPSAGGANLPVTAPPLSNRSGWVGAASQTYDGSRAENPSQVRLPQADFASLEPLDADTELPSLELLGRSGYIIEGWGHVVAGYPKCGKTELLFACVRAWAKAGIRVLWFSEEGENIWRIRRGNVDDVPEGALRLVYALGIQARHLRREAEAATEAVIIVDTVRNLFGLKDESDNAEIARTLAPWEGGLQGKTRVYLHHTNKKGGEHGKAIAGGAAFLGVVDRSLEIERDQHEPKRRRVLKVESRIIGAPDLLYEMRGGQLKALGDPGALTKEQVAASLRVLLNDEWQTANELLEALGDPQPSLSQVKKALGDLRQAGAARREPDEARPGTTYRYRAAPQPNLSLRRGAVTGEVDDDGALFPPGENARRYAQERGI